MKSISLITFFIITICAITAEAAKKWLPAVNGYSQSDANNGYAGVMGYAVTGLRVSGGQQYRVHIQGKNWLPPVTGNDKDDFNNGYAGTLEGDPIDAIAIAGGVRYAVHIKGGNWLPEVNGYDTSDDYNGYAGVLGKTIDAVMINGKTYATSYSDNGGSSSGGDNGGDNGGTKPIGNASTIINNLNNKLNDVGSFKKAAMIEAATKLLNAGYDPKFVAGVLGNIQNEGTPGQFESSYYVTNPEPAYLVYMDNNFNYRNLYSGRSITEVGIASAVDIANKAKNSGYQGKFGLGMIQWTGGRTNNLLDEYRNLSSKDVPSLIECARIEAQFIVKELQSSAYSYIYESWKSNPTAYNAGYIICTDYEVPANTNYQANERGNNASYIYSLM